MRGFNIDFEWTVFADYEVEEPRVKKPRVEEPPSILTGSRPPVYTGPIIGEEDRPAFLVAKGKPLTTRPLEAFPELYLRLAEAEPTDVGHKKFAKQYGLLTDRKREASFDWERRVKGMRKLVAMIQDQANWPINSGKFVPYGLPRGFTLSFVPSAGTGELTLSIVPISLYAALILQCASHRASSGQVRACKSCGSLFEIGGDTGHRSHAEFCSPKCRFKFHHRNRRGTL
jgi:hypothetical protein